MGEDNCIDIFTKFYEIKSKDEQDLYLQGLIDVCEVKRRRPEQKEKEKPRVSHSFSYHVMSGITREEVCLNALISVLNISEKRIRRIRQLKVLGKTPEDKRGKHISNQLSQEIRDTVDAHIRSFPLKESHYAGKKIYYLSADLNVKKMWTFFSEKEPQMKVSKNYYWSHYKENYNYAFGRPQVDTCSKCEELNLKIKSPHLNEVAKRTAVAELLVHRRMSKKFYDALRYEKSEEGMNEKDVLSIAFDFMKTVSLPRIPIQDLYYMRQLSVNVFSIHDIKNSTSKVYVYHEGQARKGPNEVCTFLDMFLSSIPQHYKKLRLFCDNCSGQNKNQSLSRYCLYLTDSGRFEKVEQFFPVRGHSFLPCDRDFGTISKALSKHDRIFSMHEITEIIINSTKSGKFEVREVEGTDILNFKSWNCKFYKKSCLSQETRGRNVAKEQKVYFSINKLFHFVYECKNKGYIKAFTNIKGLIGHTFFLAKSAGPITGPDTLAYPTGKVTIKQAKREDLIRLQNFIPHEYLEFYEEIFTWPTTTDNTPDSDFDGEEDIEEQ